VKHAAFKRAVCRLFLFFFHAIRDDKVAAASRRRPALRAPRDSVNLVAAALSAYTSPKSRRRCRPRLAAPGQWAVAAETAVVVAAAAAARAKHITEDLRSRNNHSVPQHTAERVLILQNRLFETDEWQCVWDFGMRHAWWRNSSKKCTASTHDMVIGAVSIYLRVEVGVVIVKSGS
jgi:hypothetical protein